MLIVSETPRVARTEDNFIRTYTGRKFWPLDPRADEIYIEDVAHHLSNECRFNGATCRHYSVAEHSVRVSKLAEQIILKQNSSRNAVVITSAREIALWGLLHDASEAYLKDIPTPVKYAPGFREMYCAIERMVMAEVVVRFDLMPDEPSVIKEADIILCSTEKRDLMTNSTNRLGSITLPETIYPMCAERAEVEFLRRFDALIMAREGERMVREQSNA